MHLSKITRRGLVAATPAVLAGAVLVDHLGAAAQGTPTAEEAPALVTPPVEAAPTDEGVFEGPSAIGSSFLIENGNITSRDGDENQTCDFALLLSFSGVNATSDDGQIEF